MSQTSKVNRDLQDGIVAFLKNRPGQNISNEHLFTSIPLYPYPSLRKIQEATQKMTRVGILASPKRGFYVLASTTGGTTTQPAPVAV